MTELTKQRIGLRLNDVLAQKDIKQKDLAEHIGVTPNTVSYYLSGDRCPDIEKIIEIAKYLNVTTDYLLGLSDVKSTDTKLKAICDYTGLSEDAIKRLHNCCYSEDTKKVLSFLIAPKSKSRFFDDLLNVSVDLSDYQVKYLEIVRKLSSVEPQIHTLSEKEIEDILDDVEIIMKSAKLSYYDAVEHFRLVVDSFNEFNVKTPENEALVMDCISELNIRLEEYYDGKHN